MTMEQISANSRGPSKSLNSMKKIVALTSSVVLALIKRSFSLLANPTLYAQSLLNRGENLKLGFTKFIQYALLFLLPFGYILILFSLVTMGNSSLLGMSTSNIYSNVLFNVLLLFFIFALYSLLATIFSIFICLIYALLVLLIWFILTVLGSDISLRKYSAKMLDAGGALLFALSVLFSLCALLIQVLNYLGYAVMGNFLSTVIFIGFISLQIIYLTIMTKETANVSLLTSSISVISVFIIYFISSHFISLLYG